MNSILSPAVEKEEQLILHLNEILANYQLHYQKLRNFHWNVYGQHFFELHRTFEEMYRHRALAIDELAERILTYHKHPISNFSEYLVLSSIEEVKKPLKAQYMVEELISDLKILKGVIVKGFESAKEIDDEGTLDLLIGHKRTIDKYTWMLESFIKMQA